MYNGSINIGRKAGKWVLLMHKTKQQWLDEAAIFIDGWGGIPTLQYLKGCCLELAETNPEIGSKMRQECGTIENYACTLWCYANILARGEECFRYD